MSIKLHVQAIGRCTERMVSLEREIGNLPSLTVTTELADEETTSVGVACFVAGIVFGSALQEEPRLGLRGVGVRLVGGLACGLVASKIVTAVVRFCSKPSREGDPRVEYNQVRYQREGLIREVIRLEEQAKEQYRRDKVAASIKQEPLPGRALKN